MSKRIGATVESVRQQMATAPRIVVPPSLVQMATFARALEYVLKQVEDVEAENRELREKVRKLQSDIALAPLHEKLAQITTTKKGGR
jgi:Tfp pilus assembly protein PilO